MSPRGTLGEARGLTAGLCRPSLPLSRATVVGAREGRQLTCGVASVPGNPPLSLDLARVPKQGEAGARAEKESIDGD